MVDYGYEWVVDWYVFEYDFCQICNLCGLVLGIECVQCSSMDCVVDQFLIMFMIFICNYCVLELGLMIDGEGNVLEGNFNLNGGNGFCCVIVFC